VPLEVAGLSAEEISTPDELASLESEWWEVWSRSPAATPFQSPAWLVTGGNILPMARSFSRSQSGTTANSSASRRAAITSQMPFVFSWCSAITTTDHDEIREWVESRGGHPATVARTTRRGLIRNEGEELVAAD
jgi:hypothetical protein